MAKSNKNNDQDLAIILEEIAEKTASPDDYYLIKERSDLVFCQKERRQQDNHLKPVIDTTAQFKDFADLSLNIMQDDAQKRIKAIVLQFKEQSAKIAGVTRNHSDETIRFLSWLYVSKQDFNLVYDGNSTQNVSTNPFAPMQNAAQLAQKLYKRGFLDRKLFDRFHVCSSCHSSRVNVREECMSCRSPDIEEVQIIHHFACAWQGPEADYIQGQDLVCPKCKKHLTHYGSDYEKSGIVLECNDCGDSHSAASIGFVCLDCEAHQDSETMQTISHYNYRLTDKGISFLLKSHLDYKSYPALPNQGTLSVKQLPLPLQQEIILLRYGIAPSRNKGIHPFVILEFSYKNALELTTKLGEQGFLKLRARLSDNLRAMIRQHDLFAKAPLCDYLLLKETDKDSILDLQSSFLTRCQHEIDHDLGVLIRAFDGEELCYSE